MASIIHPLLAGANVVDGWIGAMTKEIDSASSNKPASYRKCYLTVTWLSLTSLGLLGLACMYSPLMRPKSPGTVLVPGWGDAACYTVTGGTCKILNCHPERHAVCSLGNCVCETGCTGADGNCYNIRNYSLVGKSVRFTNVKYSDQYLSAPDNLWEQLQGSTKPDFWNVYKMPGGDFQNGHEMFLLSPVKFPEYVAGIANNHGISTDPFIVSLYHLTSRHLAANWFPYDPGLVMNALCRPHSHPEAVEINGRHGASSWYMHEFSSNVFGSVSTNPGEGGYWVPEPRLDIPLCGANGSGQWIL